MGRARPLHTAGFIAPSTVAFERRNSLIGTTSGSPTGEGAERSRNAPLRTVRPSAMGHRRSPSEEIAWHLDRGHSQRSTRFDRALIGALFAETQCVAELVSLSIQLGSGDSNEQSLDVLIVTGRSSGRTFTRPSVFRRQRWRDGRHWQPVQHAE